MNSCILCGDECNGTLMRFDTRYKRVYQMLTAPEVPRLRNGGIALCHTCQRNVYWRGGFLQLLAREVKREAMYAACRQRRALSEARRAA